MAISFDDIPVSTNTVIAVSNINATLEKVFKFTPISVPSATTTTAQAVECKEQSKGRKKSGKTNFDVSLYNNGDIMGKSFGKESVGVNPKETFFRNAVSVIMKIDGKIINFKVLSSKQNKRVKFQITGCKVVNHAVEAIKSWLDKVKNLEVLEHSSEAIEVVFTTVMVNVNIDLGFNINRENFDKYINNNTEYMSLLETSFGYTGLNIKVPIEPVKLSKIKSVKIRKNGHKWETSKVSYDEFLNIMVPKDRERWTSKKRYGSFLVFYSGKVIFSSFDYSLMKDDYNRFMDIIDECKEDILEKRV